MPQPCRRYLRDTHIRTVRPLRRSRRDRPTLLEFDGCIGPSHKTRFADCSSSPGRNKEYGTPRVVTSILLVCRGRTSTLTRSLGILMRNLNQSGVKVLATLTLSLAIGCASTDEPRSLAMRSRTASETLGSGEPSYEESHAAPKAEPIRSVAHQESRADTPQPLFDEATSLDELLAFALANNPQLQAAHWEAHAMQERIPQAHSLEDPMLMASPALIPTETADGPMDFMLNVSQKLPWFGKLALRRDVAAHDADAAWAEWAAVELQVMEQVRRAYYDLYFVDRAIEVNRELEAKLKQVIQVAETKYETDAERTGLESVLRARNELAKLGLMLAELQRARREALAELAHAIHLPRGVSMELRPVFAKTQFTSSVDDLVALIELCQPELAARRSELDRDLAAEALAQRDYFPDVTAGFEWQAMGATGVSPFATGVDNYYLSFGVNLPVYRRRLLAAVREAQYNAARAAERYDSAWDALRATVQKLHAQITEHDRAIELLEKQLVPQSEKTFTLSIDAYRVGRISFEQLIESYRELLQYRIDLYARQSRREQAIASLERTIGCAVTATPRDTELLPTPSPL